MRQQPLTKKQWRQKSWQQLRYGLLGCLSGIVLTCLSITMVYFHSDWWVLGTAIGMLTCVFGAVATHEFVENSEHLFSNWLRRSMIGLGLSTLVFMVLAAFANAAAIAHHMTANVT